MTPLGTAFGDVLGSWGDLRGAMCNARQNHSLMTPPAMNIILFTTSRKQTLRSGWGEDELIEMLFAGPCPGRVRS